jgi:AcrR family transcriptional regulator
MKRPSGAMTPARRPNSKRPRQDAIAAAPASAPPVVGLRARKKEATRLAISDIATRLFIERGFDAVTIAEIAEAAQVSKMTVSNYFPRKEAMFFDREDEGRELLQRALGQRRKGQSPLGGLHECALRLIDENHPFAKLDAGTASFWDTVAKSSALRARAREMRDELAYELAERLAAAVGKSAGDPPALLAAHLLLSAWHAAYAAGLRQIHIRKNPAQARATFAELLERGFRGVETALAGTPYI